MIDMKMKSSRKVECMPCDEEEEERYPCVYLDIPPGGTKALKGLDLGEEVVVTLRAKVKGLTMRDPKTSYGGSAGSVDFEVLQMDLKSAGNEFADLAEDD